MRLTPKINGMVEGHRLEAGVEADYPHDIALALIDKGYVEQPQTYAASAPTFKKKPASRK